MQALSHLCRRWGQDAPWDQHAKMGSLRYKLAFTPSFTRSFKSWPCLLGHCRNRTFKPIQIYSLFGCQTQHWGSFIGTVSNCGLVALQFLKLCILHKWKGKQVEKKLLFSLPENVSFTNLLCLELSHLNSEDNLLIGTASTSYCFWLLVSKLSKY